MMWKKTTIFTELILGSWKIVKSYVDGLSICLLQQDFETSLEVKMSLIMEWNDMVEIIWELFVKINSLNKQLATEPRTHNKQTWRAFNPFLKTKQNKNTTHTHKVFILE